MLETQSRYALLPFEEALSLVERHTPVLGTERVPSLQAFGRVLAQDVHAIEDMPRFPASSVDGYAVRSADGLAERRVLRELTAGGIATETVEPGTAMRIMTGAPVPVGADAVVMVEVTSERDGHVAITRAPRPGENVLPVGLDMKRGELVLGRGTQLGSAEIGILATMGVLEVEVHRRPRVAVLSTGDEVLEPDVPLHPGAIRDSNRYALLAAVAEANATGVSMGIVRDDERLQQERIEEALRVADVVISSGGVSMGTRDLIKPILARLGTIHFGRVSVKPGKPVTFASIGDRVAFGLPGFPVSSLVCFELFVRPTLRKLQGYRHWHRPRVPVVVDHDVRPAPDRTEYQRAVVRWENGALRARTTGAQVSSRLMSLLGANSLLHIAPGETPLPAGSTVDALLVGPIATQAGG